MVEPTAMSMMPWRIAVNSRVWSPCTSDTPGYSFMLMRPLVRCFTRSIQISAPLPHGKAVPTTVETLYSSLYFVCACGRAHRQRQRGSGNGKHRICVSSVSFVLV